MTKSQILKINHLIDQIEQIETKVDKLLSLRAVLYAQIQEIEAEKKTPQPKPTEEARRAQSLKDSAAHRTKLEKHRKTIQRTGLQKMELNLKG